VPPGGWGVYNLGQCEEKRRFLSLLHELCHGLPDPPQIGGGRRRTPMSDMAFTAIYKVYSTFSGRRFCDDLKESYAKKLLSKQLTGMMVWQFMESKLLTPVLHQLIRRSALPLRVLETKFAPDSSGFSTSRYLRWVVEKYGNKQGEDGRQVIQTFKRARKSWVKAHCIAGVRTHVVTAVEILDCDSADSPQFKALVERTAADFKVEEIMADKAYLSHDNLELVDELGGTAYIPFKSNSVAGEPGSVWEKMFHFYSMHREEFDKHYHQRSNIETVFSMIQAKFGASVRSKAQTAMTNEVLCKVVAHNICCLIMSQVELDIDVVFWGERPAPETEQPAGGDGNVIVTTATVTPPVTAVPVVAAPPATE
jgi:hypothetical protein